MGGGKTTPETTSAASITAASTAADNSGMVIVPDVTKMTEEEAKAILNAAGLGYKLSSQTNDSVAPEIIFKQSATPGSKIAKFSTLTLYISSGSSTSTVQSQVGKTEADAKTALTAAGLVVGNTVYLYSDTIKQGIVMDQAPKTGNVKANDTIILTVSRGPDIKNIPVPDVSTGKVTESDARKTLDGLGFVVVSKPTASQTIAIGNVISQDTSAGKSVPTGTTITLAISTGVAVPDVKGLDLAAAIKSYEKFGLTLKENPQTSDAAQKGKIISQLPAAGTMVDPGSNLGVYVGSGPDTTTTTKAQN